MTRCTLATTGSLGATLAMIGGLAAAEPPAPPTDLALLPEPVAAVVPAALPADRAALGLAVPAQPMAEAPLRPRLRPLGSIPTEVVEWTGPRVVPPARPVFTAAADWDGAREGEAWSVAAMEALDAAPADLRDMVPADIGSWCPGYQRNPPHLRAAFWVGTVSALARYESTFDESAVGGGGAWHGLLQISPATARAYGCEATSGEALRDGEANLACAIRIMSRTVARDGVVTAGGGGIAADWGPMSRSYTRDRIRAWVKEQSYCEAETAVMASLRPEARPEPEGDLRLASLDLAADDRRPLR